VSWTRDASNSATQAQRYGWRSRLRAQATPGHVSLKLLLLLSICAVAVFAAALLAVHPEPSERDARAVVSLAAGSLSALLALLFTISLFVVALARVRLPEYEPWILSHAFGWFTVSYLVLFIVSIMEAFITLVVGVSLLLLYVCVIMFFGCMVLIVPYYLNLRSLVALDPLVLLSQAAADKIAYDKSPNWEVSFMSMMASNALLTRNYPLFWRSLDTLLDTMLGLAGRSLPRRKKLSAFSASIRDIQILTEPLYYVTKELEHVCLLTADEPRMCRKLMAMLLFKCRMSTQEYVIDFCSKVVLLIGQSAMGRGLSYDAERAAERLWILGAMAAEKGMASAAASVVERLRLYYRTYRPSGGISLNERERQWTLRELDNYDLDAEWLDRFGSQWLPRW